MEDARALWHTAFDLSRPAKERRWGYGPESDGPAWISCFGSGRTGRAALQVPCSTGWWIVGSSSYAPRLAHVGRGVLFPTRFSASVCQAGRNRPGRCCAYGDRVTVPLARAIELNLLQILTVAALRVVVEAGRKGTPKRYKLRRAGIRTEPSAPRLLPMSAIVGCGMRV